MLTPNNHPAPGLAEAQQTAADLAALGPVEPVKARVAQKVGRNLHPMPTRLRRRETAALDFLINYNATPVDWNGHSIAACGDAILKRNPPGQE